MPKSRFWFRPQGGQALVEYALLVVLLVMLFAVMLAATGPAIGNVFSNTIYNLLGYTITPRVLPDSNSFWATVTWVSLQTPVESPFPTNLPLPPPATATAGPSPTPSPTRPTATPRPSATPGPSNTPTDFQLQAPAWFERADPDTAMRWRLDRNVFLGGEEWIGQYYPNTSLSGLYTEQRANSTLTPPSPFGVNFLWPGNSAPLTAAGGWPAANPGQNYSVRWYRRLYLTAPVTLVFSVRVNDGARLYVMGPDTGGNINDPTAGPSCAATCRKIDAWSTRTSAATFTSSAVTLNPGYHLLVLEYFEGTGDAEIALDIRPQGVPVNSNDVNPNGCNWGRTNSATSSTRSWMWEEYIGGDIPANTRCTLEFRGSVFVPGPTGNPPLASPHFIFWSAWDFTNSATQAYIEFSQYTLNADNTYTLGPWNRVNLHQGNSANYNWTRFAINLSSLPGSGVNLVGSGTGQKIAFRFVIDNGAVSTGARMWYVDDMTIQTFSPDSNIYRVGTYFDLNSDAQRTNFITSERWGLSTFIRGGAGTDMTFDDSPGGATPFTPGSASNVTYSRFQASDCPAGTCPAPVASPGQPNTSRVHYVEFNGWVDLSGNLPDRAGNVGPPILTFLHAYQIGARGRLEVQYTRDPFISTAAPNSSNRTNWMRVPGPTNRDGNILALDNGITRQQLALTAREVALDSIPNFDTQRFRLRFAMILDRDAVETDGWWIDNIEIARVARPQFSPYPFFDDAEVGDGNWRMEGNWARYQGGSVFGAGSWLYTDSPQGNYLGNQELSMQLRWPLDLRNDTPDNLNPVGATPAPTPGNQGGAAVRPFLTFWHRRDLALNHNFSVDWRRYRDTAWNTLWTYNSQDTTVNGLPNNTRVTSSNTLRQVAWERVAIDLRPVLQMADTSVPDLTDDDIIIRFRLDARAANTPPGQDPVTADGLSIDNVSIQEYSETTWALWPAGFDPDGAGPLPAGSGEAYFESIDSPVDWWTRWHTGGDWGAIDWNTLIGGGLRSFHDSGVGQTEAPFLLYDRTFSPALANQYDGITYGARTFNVLEMARIMDLRAVTSSNRPTLEFWHRYWVGNNHRLLVQVAPENVAAPIDTAPCGGTVGNFSDPPRQCYERLAGWDRWTTVYTLAGDTRNYSWTRQLVDLSSYAGQRIRVRFVTDAGAAGTLRDGWYLDNMRFFYNNYTTPIPFQLPFADNARNMSRWIAEGQWGLDPERFRGSGGGPADLGTAPWNAYWFNCNSCSPTSAATFLDGVADTPTGYANARTAVGAGNFFPTTQPQFLLDVNFEFGNNGPRFPDGSIWRSNNFLARFTRDVTVQGGEYTFITISDDGVRMRYTPDPAPPTGSGACRGWNIICRWTTHGRAVDIHTFSFPANGNYRIILEWFEGTGEAIIVASTGSNNFSFSDSPKLGIGPAFPQVDSTAWSSSALTLDGVVDMCGAREPVLEFYTIYQTASNNNLIVEVSTNGGLDWTRGNFSGPPGGHDGVRALPNITPTPRPLVGSFNGSLWSGTSSGFPSVWELRRYNMWAYANRFMSLRFRMTTQDQVSDGWWITDILLGAASITPRNLMPPGICP
ncbi:MAG: hypothetical protein HXY40_07785 [Chloroflexi bacterium]|nr:hypothetical protein [Chloroflexota bacterium]